MGNCRVRRRRVGRKTQTQYENKADDSRRSLPGRDFRRVIDREQEPPARRVFGRRFTDTRLCCCGALLWRRDIPLEAPMFAELAKWWKRSGNPTSASPQDYRVYTTEFDRIIHGDQLPA